MASSRHIPIPGTFNIRDLGGYATGDGSETRWRRFLRADSLHKLDEAGIEALLAEGLTTVVDLRHNTELLTSPNPFAARNGVTYLNVDLLADLLPDSNREYQEGFDVLLDLYVRVIDDRGAMILQILDAIAEAPDGAVLFHCAAGKDRTGIVAALLLSVAGVGRDHVLDDYELTAVQMVAVLPDYERRAAERGQDLRSMYALLASPRETMAALLDHIDARHGGIVAYLDAIGLSAGAVDRLRSRILHSETDLGQ